MLDKFCRKLQRDFGFTNKERNQIHYILSAIWSDGSKLVIMGIFFFITGRLLEYIIATTILWLFRTNSGGIHFKHYSSCFAFSFFLMVMCILVMPQFVIVNKAIINISLIFFAIIVAIIKPVRAVGRPAVTHSSNMHFKFSIWKYLFLYLLLTYVSDVNNYLIVGYWIIVFQLTQLIIANIIKSGFHHKRKEDY